MNLNIIEKVWKDLTPRVYNEFKQYQTVEELIEATKSVWEPMSTEYISKLYCSILKWLMFLLDPKGVSKNY